MFLRYSLNSTTKVSFNSLIAIDFLFTTTCAMGKRPITIFGRLYMANMVVNLVQNTFPDISIVFFTVKFNYEFKKGCQ